MNRFGKFVCISALALVPAYTLAQTVSPAIPVDPMIEAKIDNQQSRMTLDEKLGQMTQVEINLHLSTGQTEPVKRLAARGKTIILVLNQRRSRPIYDIESLVQAVVDVMLPGNYGGEALAEQLAGDSNFSGRLPFTYPSCPQTFTTYDYKVG